MFRRVRAVSWQGLKGKIQSRSGWPRPTPFAYDPICPVPDQSKPTPLPQKEQREPNPRSRTLALNSECLASSPAVKGVKWTEPLPSIWISSTAGYCPKILLLKPAIGVIGKSALEIGHFLRRNFWMISGGPPLSRPLCFTAEWNQTYRTEPQTYLWEQNYYIPFFVALGMIIGNYCWGNFTA